MNTANDHLALFAKSLTIGGGLVSVWALVVIGGPYAEMRFLPVVEEMRVNEVVDDDGLTVRLHVVGVKARLCRYVETRALVLVDGQWSRADVEFPPRPASAGSTRPLGLQDFGVWTVTPSGQAVQFELVHDCHHAWPTLTRFEWRLKKHPPVVGPIKEQQK